MWEPPLYRLLAPGTFGRPAGVIMDLGQGSLWGVLNPRPPWWGGWGWSRPWLGAVPGSRLPWQVAGAGAGMGHRES